MYAAFLFWEGNFYWNLFANEGFSDILCVVFFVLLIALSTLWTFVLFISGGVLFRL